MMKAISELFFHSKIEHLLQNVFLTFTSKLHAAQQAQI